MGGAGIFFQIQHFLLIFFSSKHHAMLTLISLILQDSLPSITDISGTVGGGGNGSNNIMETTIYSSVFFLFCCVCAMHTLFNVQRQSKI